jgi:serpin B
MNLTEIEAVLLVRVSAGRSDSKSKIMSLSRLVLIFSISIMCVEPALSSEEDADLTAAKRAAESVNAFAFDLYKLIAKTQNESIIISPYSIYSAMGMLELGSAGKGKEEIDNALYFGDNHHAGLKALKNQISNVFSYNDTSKLYVSNAIFPSDKFIIKDSYIKNLGKFYDSDIVTVDYNSPKEAAAVINEWIEEKTESKIKNLIHVGQIEPTAPMVLASAALFEAGWYNQFPEGNTKDEKFYGGAKSEVKMMYQEDYFRYAETDDFQVIGMPYFKRRLLDFSEADIPQVIKMLEKSHSYRVYMYVILPLDFNGLRKIEECLSSKKLPSILAEAYETKIVLSLPNFSFTKNVDLISCLNSLNIYGIFNPNINNLPAMSERTIYINKILHHALIKVNERGTEAAGVSIVFSGMTASVQRPVGKKIFNANHPFLFLIREESTGVILFMGRFTGRE